jgi:hypothetical protein
MCYALLSLAADISYTNGANDLFMPPLELAARVFPFSHDFRLGPARLIILTNEWVDKRYAVWRLKEALKYDPNSHYLKNWIAAFKQR